MAPCKPEEHDWETIVLRTRLEGPVPLDLFDATTICVRCGEDKED